LNHRQCRVEVLRAIRRVLGKFLVARFQEPVGTSSIGVAGVTLSCHPLTGAIDQGVDIGDRE